MYRLGSQLAANRPEGRRLDNFLVEVWGGRTQFAIKAGPISIAIPHRLPMMTPKNASANRPEGRRLDNFLVEFLGRCSCFALSVCPFSRTLPRRCSKTPPNQTFTWPCVDSIEYVPLESLFFCAIVAISGGGRGQCHVIVEQISRVRS